MNVYLIGALVAAVLVAGAGVQGYRLGEDHVRAEDARTIETARNEAEAKRNAEAAKARQLAAGLQTALTKQRNLSHDLGNALEAHIRAIPKTPAGCPAPGLTDSLLNDWNAANHASGPPGRSVPEPGRSAAAPDGTVLGSGDQEPR